MKIEFNPLNSGECEAVKKVIALLQNSTAMDGVVELQSTEDVESFAGGPSEISDQIAAVTSDTATNTATDTSAPSGATLDCHGMTHNPDYHQSPPKQNADGSWKAGRGKADELKAAILAHKQSQSAATGAAMAAQTNTQPQASDEPIDPLRPVQQPGGMPAPKRPATNLPNTPAEPVDYEKLGARFGAMVDGGKIQNYELLYDELGVDWATLDTDQRAIDAMWCYMDFIDAGHEHLAALQATLSRFPAAQ